MSLLGAGGEVRQNQAGRSSPSLAPLPLGCSAHLWRAPSCAGDGLAGWTPVRPAVLAGQAGQRQLEALAGARDPAVWLGSCHCGLQAFSWAADVTSAGACGEQSWHQGSYWVGRATGQSPAWVQDQGTMPTACVLVSCSGSLAGPMHITDPALEVAEAGSWQEMWLPVPSGDVPWAAFQEHCLVFPEVGRGCWG